MVKELTEGDVNMLMHLLRRDSIARETRTVEDIYQQIVEHSQLRDMPLEHVLGNLIDMAKRDVYKRSMRKRGSPEDCDPNPCLHNGRCSYKDHAPDVNFQCYSCDKEVKDYGTFRYLGPSCEFYDPCKRDGPYWELIGETDPTCGSGQICMESGNSKGYYCL